MEEKKTIKFGHKLKLLRKKQFLSQEDLAELSKLDRKYIGNLERDASSPTLETMYKLSVALSITLSELIKEIEEVDENRQRHKRSGRNKIYAPKQEVITLSELEETMYTLDIIDRRVSRLINEYNDEIEMEIIKYPDHYKVVVTICQEELPYKDFIGIGTDRWSARRAAKKALLELYNSAYLY